ncbi:hypothetical protein [Phocaeicola paurosaccharolyticus]|uniref:hypothetical protein n=1 Tax=Phocaeicola paurosaccharolyticus TaxID=732242 RepID=UPI002FE3F471
MIDKLTITIPECTCKPSTNGLYKGREYQWSIYWLYYDADDDNEAFLKIKYNRAGMVIQIEGSIRKWYLGMFSLSDLTPKQFEFAIKKVAEMLSIDWNKLLEGTITNCEVGLDVQTRIPAQKVNELIRKYRGLKYYRYEYETVGFLGEHTNLKMYDKYEELLANFGKYDEGGKVKKKFEELKKKRIYTYRIEATIKDDRSFNLASLGHLSTLGGLIENYHELIEYWVNECSKVEVGMSINYEDERMTKNEYAILIAIHSQGFFTFSDEYAKRSLHKKNAKGKKINGSATTSISKAKKEISQIIERYKEPTSYHVSKFRVDIYKTLKDLYGDLPQISMKELIQSLWGVRKTVQDKK